MKAYDEYGTLAIDDILEDIESSYDSRLNQYKMPVTVYKLTEENCILFNNIVSCLYKSFLRKIERNPSGAIKGTMVHIPAYDVRFEGGCIEVTIINYNGSRRIQWRNSSEDIFSNNKLIMTGHRAFLEFKKICYDFNIDLAEYAHEDKKQAKAEKESIQQPLIRVSHPNMLNKTFYNVHHIDFHSSYMGGLANKHPEFSEIVDYIYDKRHDNNIKYKSILNMTQGYMQSKMVGYKYAWLSRDMIADNNDRVINIASDLVDSGRTIIMYNTDGIWYSGEVYHGEGEGTRPGEWENDHINCKFRAKSNGSYEYEEEGIYHPVVRGRTLLDRIKPRTEWVWGDIYQEECSEIIYSYKNGYLWWNNACEGVVEYEEA